MAKGKKNLSPKKLLFRLWQFPHLSETFITAQIITAIKCGFDVSILVIELLDFEESKQYPILKKYAIPEKIILEDFKIPQNKIHRLLNIITLLPGLLANFKLLIEYLKAQDQFSLSHLYKFYFYLKLRHFDIVHVQYGTNAKPFDLLKKLNIIEAKLLVSFHGHDVFFPINGWIENQDYYDDLFLYGDLMVANTPYLAEKIEGLGCSKDKIKTIPVGVDTHFFKSTEVKKSVRRPFRIINVGRLDKVKGHTYGIEVIKLLKSRGLEVQFIIIGEGEEREALQQKIDDLGLQNEVSLPGRKSQVEVKDYLVSSQLYILPAVAVANERRETQGLATLEAQACGLPAVVFDSGGVKYTVIDGQTGFVVPEYAVETMADKIQFLMEDPQALENMSKNTTAFIEQNYSMVVIDEKWRGLYCNW